MNNYITIEDYDVQTKNEILKLLDNTLERSAIEHAERMAIDQITNFIGGRYDCPKIFATRGDDRDQFLVMITIDIALYHLWSKKAPRTVPDIRKERYNAALDWITDVGQGDIPTALPPLDNENNKGEIRLFSLYKPNYNKY